MVRRRHSHSRRIAGETTGKRSVQRAITRRHPRCARDDVRRTSGTTRTRCHHRAEDEVMRLRLVAGFVAIALCSRDLRAQRGADGFSDLRIDGNGIDALSTTVGSGFEGHTTAYALTWIARLARLNLTFDPQLAAMSTRLSIPPHDRSAAAALLEVARESRISVRVSASGQIVVAALPAPAVVQMRIDTV